MHCAPAAGPVRIFLDWVFAVDPLCIGPLSLGLCGYYLDWVFVVNPLCIGPLVLGLCGYFGLGPCC